VFVLGEPQNVSSIAANNGTTITATDLFKKLPVRRNYMLKGTRKNDDLKKIEHLIKSFAMIISDLRISLFHNSKMVFIKSASRTILDSIQKVANIPSESFCHLGMNVGNALVDLWVPKCVETRTESPLASEDNGQYKVYLFMNQRPVSDKKIEKVLRKYLLLAASLTSVEKSLSSMMCIETAKSEIDVNLDPNKNTVFLVKHMDILAALEDKLKEYYDCSLDDIEKRRVEKGKLLIQTKKEIVLLDDDTGANAPMNQIENNEASKSIGTNSNTPFGNDNSFGALLDNDFDKLFKSKQKLTPHTVSSSEQNDNHNRSKESSIEEVTAFSNKRQSDLSDSSVEHSWSRGNMFKGDGNTIVSPVAHYKQPKITVFGDEIEDWKNDSNSFVQQQKRVKLHPEKEKDFQLDKPRTVDKAKRREGAGNRTMEDLAKGLEDTPEMSRSQSSKMFRYD
jgi:DNA mismatch repair ATPase MutL